ncbi:hypothetical protein GmarT_20350 [Gimesia maris]|uniref:Uncharacterized protein n=1 Tax=Gimesia maris TaxID=122 RepID=A0ABX5YKK4_9PLAN|nr:hypothetical protein CA11_19580 [Gimesia maris]QEG16174.1 hypothetical protein GmarT_20350 [Gimesia maris]
MCTHYECILILSIKKHTPKVFYTCDAEGRVQKNKFILMLNISNRIHA